MGKFQIYIIGILVIIILAMLFFKGNKGEIKSIEAAAKSKIEPHIAKLVELGRHVIILQHKLKTDSSAAQKSKITYESKISKLKNELAAAKFTGKPADVPDDSLQLAMDCLEKEPIRDSIDAINYARIAKLEKEKADLIKDYEQIMDDNQGEKNELQAMIDVKNQEIAELTKQAKRANRKAKLRLIEGAVLGGLVGVGIGSISH